MPQCSAVLPGLVRTRRAASARAWTWGDPGPHQAAEQCTELWEAGDSRHGLRLPGAGRGDAFWTEALEATWALVVTRKEPPSVIGVLSAAPHPSPHFDSKAQLNLGAEQHSGSQEKLETALPAQAPAASPRPTPRVALPRPPAV